MFKEKALFKSLPGKTDLELMAGSGMVGLAVVLEMVDLWLTLVFAVAHQEMVVHFDKFQQELTLEQQVELGKAGLYLQQATFGNPGLYLQVAFGLQFQEAFDKFG